MSDEHIIGMHSPDERRDVERRQLERRRADRDLIARLDALEGVASNYRLNVAREEHIQRERRYALLQAAAILATSPLTKDPIAIARLFLETIEDDEKRERERKDPAGDASRCEEIGRAE